MGTDEYGQDGHAHARRFTPQATTLTRERPGGGGLTMFEGSRGRGPVASNWAGVGSGAETPVWEAEIPAEPVVGAGYWPLPTYADMLFCR